MICLCAPVPITTTRNGRHVVQFTHSLMCPRTEALGTTVEERDDGPAAPAPSGICTYCNVPRSQCNPFTCREH